MDVIVDGQRDFPLDNEHPDALAVLAAVSEHLQGKNRSILSVKANGQDLKPEDIRAQLEGKSLSDIETLEVLSEDMGAMVRACLDELEQALPDLPTACHHLAAVFQSETPTDGFEPFNRLAEIWSHVKSQQLLVINALELNVDEIQVDGKSLSELHEGLNRHLAEAIDALKAEDCVLLGDLLEYELAPRAEKEEDIVTVLREETRRRFG